MESIQLATDPGAEVRLYPNAVEFWRFGVREFVMTPAVWHEVKTFIDTAAPLLHRDMRGLSGATVIAGVGG